MRQKAPGWGFLLVTAKTYLPQDILAEMQATYDAGLPSWIFWDPANKYENVRAVMSE
ncbi:MAG: hypothetical protein WBK28_03445 [Minisyncoccia bacterium]